MCPHGLPFHLCTIDECTQKFNGFTNNEPKPQTFANNAWWDFVKQYLKNQYPETNTNPLPDWPIKEKHFITKIDTLKGPVYYILAENGPFYFTKAAWLFDGELVS